MDNQGWVKLHRGLKDSPIYSNSVAVHCWVECLLRASHKPVSFFIGLQKVDLEAGQFVTGRIEFGKSIGVSPSTAWFWVQQFKKEKILDIKPTNKFSIFTVLNWKEYQGLDSRITAEKQQNNTINNVKNVKKKEKYKKKVLKHLTKEELLRISKKYATAFSDANQVHNAVWESIESGDKYKVKDVSLTVANWLRRSIGRGEVETLDEVSLRNDQMLNSPTYKEDLKLLVKQHEDGKPILDFSRVGKKVS